MIIVEVSSVQNFAPYLQVGRENEMLMSQMCCCHLERTQMDKVFIIIFIIIVHCYYCCEAAVEFSWAFSFFFPQLCWVENGIGKITMTTKDGHH